MFKMITLLKRRADMSVEDFIAYYEGAHARLGARLMSPYAVRYRRNYLAAMTNPLTGEAIAPEYDAVTEVWFPDRATWETAMAVFSQPGPSAEMSADEERLFDRSRSRLMIVDQICETSFPEMPLRG